MYLQESRHQVALRIPHWAGMSAPHHRVPTPLLGVPPAARWPPAAIVQSIRGSKRGPTPAPGPEIPTNNFRSLPSAPVVHISVCAHCNTAAELDDEEGGHTRRSLLVRSSFVRRPACVAKRGLGDEAGNVAEPELHHVACTQDHPSLPPPHGTVPDPRGRLAGPQQAAVWMMSKN